jgi:hypothetical protein
MFGGKTISEQVVFRDHLVRWLEHHAGRYFGTIWRRDCLLCGLAEGANTRRSNSDDLAHAIGFVIMHDGAQMSPHATMPL